MPANPKNLSQANFRVPPSTHRRFRELLDETSSSKNKSMAGIMAWFNTLNRDSRIEVMNGRSPLRLRDPLAPPTDAGVHHVAHNDRKATQQPMTDAREQALARAIDATHTPAQRARIEDVLAWIAGANDDDLERLRAALLPAPAVAGKAGREEELAKREAALDKPRVEVVERHMMDEPARKSRPTRRKTGEVGERENPK